MIKQLKTINRPAAAVRGVSHIDRVHKHSAIIIVAQTTITTLDTRVNTPSSRLG
jgi:hypothetical protein